MLDALCKVREPDISGCLPFVTMRVAPVTDARVRPLTFAALLFFPSQGSLLQTHYMHNLQNIIFEPFAAHAMPGLPATQQLVANANASAHGHDAAMTQ